MLLALQALDPEFGGSPATGLDAVVAKLARAKAGKGYASAREALLLNGRFVLGQLAAHEARKSGGTAAAKADMGKGKAPAGVTGGPFCSELEAEVSWQCVLLLVLMCNWHCDLHRSCEPLMRNSCNAIIIIRKATCGPKQQPFKHGTVHRCTVFVLCQLSAVCLLHFWADRGAMPQG